MTRKILVTLTAALVALIPLVLFPPPASAGSTTVLVAEYRSTAYSRTQSITTGNGRCMVTKYTGTLRVWYTKSRDDILGTIYRSMINPEILNPALDIKFYDKCGSGRVLKSVANVEYDAKYYYYGCGIASGSLGISASAGGLSASAGVTIKCGTEYLARHADAVNANGYHFTWSTSQDAKWNKKKLTTSSTVQMCIDADYTWTVKVKTAGGTSARSGNTYMGAPCISAT